MGAVASGGVRVLNPEIVEQLHLPDEVIDTVTSKTYVAQQFVLGNHERRPLRRGKGWVARVHVG